MSGAGIDIGAYHPWGDLSWTAGGACRMHKGPDYWFPNRDNADVYYAKAKAVCEGCPVRKACGDYAAEARIPDGMWGGMTPEERGVTGRRNRTSVTRNRKAREPEGQAPQGHGTARAYDAGCRCDHCRWAVHLRYLEKKAAKSAKSTGRTTSDSQGARERMGPTTETAPGAAVTAAEGLERPTQEVTP